MEKKRPKSGSRVSPSKGVFKRDIRRVRCTAQQCRIPAKSAAEAMASLLQQLPTDDSVVLRVTHCNLKTFSADVRFSLQVPAPSLDRFGLGGFAVSPSARFIRRSWTSLKMVYKKITHRGIVSCDRWQSSVESVKEKLWRKCGTSVDSMRLELYDDSGSKVSDLSEDSRPLGFYSPLDRLVQTLY